MRFFLTVLLLQGRIARICLLKEGRRNIKRASPDFHLILSVFQRRLRFVQSLKGSVMPLIQLPGFNHRQPAAIHFLQNVIQGMNRSF